MMAAIVITQPTEDSKLLARAKAPRTGGVRHPCVFCDSRGYSAREKKEQLELLSLMSEVGKLRQGKDCTSALDPHLLSLSRGNLEIDETFFRTK